MVGECDDEVALERENHNDPRRGAAARGAYERKGATEAHLLIGDVERNVDLKRKLKESVLLPCTYLVLGLLRFLLN